MCPTAFFFYFSPVQLTCLCQWLWEDKKLFICLICLEVCARLGKIVRPSLLLLYVAQNTWTSQKATSYTDNGEMVSPPVASVSSTCFVKMWQEKSKAADIGHSQRRIFDVICVASGARKAYCGVEEKASFGLASFLASWTDRLRQLSRLQNSNYVIPETH